MKIKYLQNNIGIEILNRS